MTAKAELPHSKKRGIMKCRNKECNNDRASDRTECHSCRGKRRRGTAHNHQTRWDSDSGPRILFIDIETAPDLAWVWDIWNQNIGINQIKESGEVICFAARWYGSDEILYYSKWVDGKEAMVDAMWYLLDEADIVIHYYGSKFDIPWMNREIALKGMVPPSPFKQVDLKTSVAKRFKFTSNKLQWVSTQFGLPGKIEHEGFELWRKCMEGDEDARYRMMEYNKQDVVLLEELYEILLPWLPNHPHRYLYDGKGECPRCGSDLPLTDCGYAYTRLSKYPQFRCMDCGSVFRGCKRIDGVTLQDSLL